MAIILFDPNDRDRLLPLASTRAFADIRLGILTQRERWEQRTKEKVGVATAGYLRCLYDTLPEGEYTWIDASVYPDKAAIDAIYKLTSGPPCVRMEVSGPAELVPIRIQLMHCCKSRSYFMLLNIQSAN
ncbi:MAG: hypothetical protein IM547_00370 [Chitinophagaceae bacterium]|nr:hypothetical protein [Chitinophagaceae bacterium]